MAGIATRVGGGEAGIDLIAKTLDGGLWAVQAKAYNPSYAIKKRDVDSFLSESSRPQCAYRLLIATTDRIGARLVMACGTGNRTRPA